MHVDHPCKSLLPAGDVSAYDEVEAFPTTPRGPSPGQQAHALAGNPFQRHMPALSGSQSPAPAAAAVAALSLSAATAPGAAAGKADGRSGGRAHLPPPPGHLRPAAFPAPRASAEATLPEGAAAQWEGGVGPLTRSANHDAAGTHAAKAARLSGGRPQQQAQAGQRPPGVSGSALEPGPAQLRPCCSSSRAPHPSQNGLHEAAAVPKQAPPPPPPPPLQEQRPHYISAGALADAAGRLKPAAMGNGASHKTQVCLDHKPMQPAVVSGTWRYRSALPQTSL